MSNFLHATCYCADVFCTNTIDWFQEVKRKYLIRSVTHPVTHEEISIKDAIDKRIVIMERGIYVNPESGSYLTIPEAMQRDLIKVSAPSAPVTHARNNPR